MNWDNIGPIVSNQYTSNTTQTHTHAPVPPLPCHHVSYALRQQQRRDDLHSDPHNVAPVFDMRVLEVFDHVQRQGVKGVELDHGAVVVHLNEAPYLDAIWVEDADKSWELGVAKDERLHGRVPERYANHIGAANLQDDSSNGLETGGMMSWTWRL